MVRHFCYTINVFDLTIFLIKLVPVPHLFAANANYVVQMIGCLAFTELLSCFSAGTKFTPADGQFFVIRYMVEGFIYNEYK